MINGGSLHKLAAVLGHSSTEVTQRYGHLVPGEYTLAERALVDLDLRPAQVFPMRKRADAALLHGCYARPLLGGPPLGKSLNIRAVEQPSLVAGPVFKTGEGQRRLSLASSIPVLYRHFPLVITANRRTFAIRSRRNSYGGFSGPLRRSLSAGRLSQRVGGVALELSVCIAPGVETNLCLRDFVSTLAHARGP